MKKIKSFYIKFKIFYKSSNWIVKHLIKMGIFFAFIMILLNIVSFKVGLTIDKEYKIDGIAIPSIESVVGSRHVPGKYVANNMQVFTYTDIENPQKDVDKYIDYLIEEHGYEEIGFDKEKKIFKKYEANKFEILIEIQQGRNAYEISIRKAAI